MNVPAEVPVPEIRDYQKINLEVARLLHEGHTRVRLTGVEGQRLLLSGLRGDWSACVEVEGNPGPELASHLEAPGLHVVCTGSTADGAGHSLVRGHLLIRGSAGDATAGYLRGGSVTVLGAVGHRAGLRQAGGTLVVGGRVGRLLADRLEGGLVLVGIPPDALGRTLGRKGSGGQVVSLDTLCGDPGTAGIEALRRLDELARIWEPWVGEGIFPWPTRASGPTGGSPYPVS